jgi:membrane fusion protein (multidrug efflux system)
MRAPFSGRAGLHTFEVGEYLQQNTHITSLIGDTENLWVDFQVPQFYPALAVGSEVSLSTIGNGMGGKNVVATVIAENTVLNAGSRSRAYRASLSRDAGQFAPQGMVNLLAPIGEAEPLLSVPSIAVQNDPLGQYVFVLNEDEDGKGFRAARQQVKVKVINGNTALLEPGTGLTEGQRIAADGAFKLYPGILVIIGERPVANTVTMAGDREEGVN